MGDNMATSGGGLHPGRPVIWPTGKQSQTQSVPQPSQEKTTQQSQQSQQSQQAQQAQQAAQNTKATQQAMRAQTLSQKQVARELTVKDLKQHLINQQILDNEFNVQLSTMMLRYGMEVSKSSFEKVMNMLSGTDKSVTAQEAAILLLKKGIESPEATKTLASFLKENPRIASQLMNLSANMADLQAALGLAKGVLPTQMIQALAAMLSQFGESIPGLPKKFKFSGNNTTGRSELVNDMRAMRALLSGVRESASLPDTAEGQIIESNILSTMETLDKSIANIVSQSFLSKQAKSQDVNYSYYQVPNSMVKPPQTVDIVIKRSLKDGGKTIDPKDTRIIMTLDTMNLGKVAISMTVKDKKVDFIFNTQDGDVKELFRKQSADLAAALSENDFSASKMEINVNPSMCTMSTYLIPFLGVEDLMLIDTSA